MIWEGRREYLEMFNCFSFQINSFPVALKKLCFRIETICILHVGHRCRPSIIIGRTWDDVQAKVRKQRKKKNVKVVQKVGKVQSLLIRSKLPIIYKCPGARTDGVNTPNKSKPLYIRWISLKYCKIQLTVGRGFSWWITILHRCSSHMTGCQEGIVAYLEMTSLTVRASQLTL